MSDPNDQPPRPAGEPTSEMADEMVGEMASDEHTPIAPASAKSAPTDEARLLAALRQGDEGAFMALVTMHYSAMLRLAQVYVGTRAVAEDVIQETWLGVLQGLNRFEGRSSLKTWIFRILLNRARTRAQRENRSIPFSALASDDAEPFEPAVEPDAFRPPGDQYPGGWLRPPSGWDTLPEERLLSGETRQQIDAALTTLPPSQRAVITLRDIDGWSASEVCDYLSISEANQRVLLHRARARVRRALAGYLAG